MGLERIIEQRRARRILESMVTGDRLPHALLFWGSAGIGKSAAAIELARWLNCDDAPNGPCGNCASCVKFDRLEHPHFSYQMALPRKALADPEQGELSKEGAEQMAEILQAKGHDLYRSASYEGGQFILIGQIRSLLHWANIKSFSDRPRVALIDRAENLKEEAGNALLKLLEEPPPNFILILTAETPEDVLPTLKSRCHLLEFERLSDTAISAALNTRNFDAEAAAWTAKLAAGNLSRAIEFCENTEKIEKLHEFAINVVRHSLGKSPFELDALIEIWGKMDASGRYLILEIIASWLRDAAVLKELGSEGESRLVHSSKIELLSRFVANCPKADFISAARHTEEARASLEGNALPQLVLVILARQLYRAIYQKRPI